MISRSLVRKILWTGSVYDLALGVLAFLAYPAIYRVLQIDPANHAAYVQLPALFIVALGIMQGLAARRPESSGDLLLCTILMKMSYAGVVLGHFFFGAIPGVWVVFAFCDLGFIALYAGYLLGRPVGV